MKNVLYYAITAMVLWAVFVPGVNVLTRDVEVNPVIAATLAILISIAAQVVIDRLFRKKD